MKHKISGRGWKLTLEQDEWDENVQTHTTYGFMEAVCSLYAKVGFKNDMTIAIHGGDGGDKTISYTYNPHDKEYNSHGAECAICGQYHWRLRCGVCPTCIDGVQIE
jgi:hypothetical protein